MNERENYLRTIEFRTPDWIPCSVSCSPVTWHRYHHELTELSSRHPRLLRDPGGGNHGPEAFPAAYREGEYFRDNWGCLWYSSIGGLEGQVVQSPLSNWRALDDYSPPDFHTMTERGERNWTEIRRDIEQKRRDSMLTVGNGERLFDRLYFLRGFENLMIDIATEDPRLNRLIDMLLEYELGLIRMWLDIGVDAISFHTDIGAQDRLMISPGQFRKLIKPMFRELFQTCRRAGTHVLLSSDGRLLDIVDDLIECGVSLHDPQLRANTIEGIGRHYKGVMCINVDLDRQMFAFCTPEDIRKQVQDVVDSLYDPRGGLMLSASVCDACVPMENVEALCETLERVCF